MVDDTANIIEISCDEAGFTGPDLLHVEQRYFAYASTSITDGEAWEIITRARSANPVQMPELKATKLLKTVTGRALVSELFHAAEGRYAVNVNDKMLALCAWLFEYIYEPVYRDDPGLLYDKNFHRFIAMFGWLWVNDPQAAAAETIQQFQKYMRSLDPTDAPILFDHTSEGEPGANEHPFQLICRFATGYRDLIVADNARLMHEAFDGGRWTLDLSASALWSHLNHWGQFNRPLKVKCDVSKPLQELVGYFTGDEGDPTVKRARLMGNKDRLGWCLSEPVRFIDSRNHPAAQLADVLAGTCVAITSNSIEFEGVSESIGRHLMRDSVLPDMDIIDLSKRSPAVNYLILFDLAMRAYRHADPYLNLANTYRVAEIGWVRGDFPTINLRR